MSPDMEMETNTSLYSIVGVDKNSSTAEIRSAYKKLAMKWHPDKWSKDRSSAEQAKLRFQQIQEAYSVLSNETKRALYDAGMYEPCEDDDAFCDFLDEMASLMADVRDEVRKEMQFPHSKGSEDSFEELQQMFMEMVQEDWFSTDSEFDQSTSLGSFQSTAACKSNEWKEYADQPLWKIPDILQEELEENDLYSELIGTGGNLDIESCGKK
eukprot:Gb_36620 [translate_table: standard]